MDETVEYREVPGFPGYLVGSDASVWSNKKKGNWADKTSSEWRRMKVKRHKRGQYLLVTLIHDRKYKNFLLHRLVLLCFVGPPPTEKHLGLHEDDDKTNNTPNNLYWGLHEQNMKDAVRNGKTTRGEINGCAKLTEEQAKEIIRLRAEEGIGSRRLAKMFGVVPQTIQMILDGTNWSYLERKATTISQGDTVRGTKNPSAALTEAQVLMAVELREKHGLSQQKIANALGVHQTAISLILSGKTWSEVTGIIYEGK